VEDESVDQSGGKLCRLPSDEIILWLRNDEEALVVRSQDAGRTWSGPEPDGRSGWNFLDN